MIAPPMALATVLQDRYKVERELGRGGMATVYLAHDSRHDRQVAVKVLHPELSNLLGRERFLREIEIASRLQHPNILSLFDSGADGDLLYYVMPYVEGESLRDLLDREKQLALDHALGITREVADALAYAHAHGVVHRDIKPANILLSQGHALVADFGIARAVRAAGSDQLTTRGIAIGTPAYMSPEQATGDGDVDGRSDLYSLGCVLFEMLAGEPPFSGRTAQAIAARHLHDPPPSLRTVRPSVAAEVQQVIETALAKVRADRYATLGRFVAALDAASGGRGAVKRRRWAGAAGLFAVAALVGLVRKLDLTFGASLDDNKVVVFPLAELPSDRRIGGTGEAIAVMIESALEHTEPLRWIDGWQQLDLEQRSNPALVTAAAARKIALDRGARWYTTGTAVHRGESTTVVLRLNDAQGDSTLHQASTTALTAEAPQAGLRAINELLVPILAPGRRLDLTSLAERRPAAVAMWLQGEAEYRRGNFDSALVYLRRAVVEDSVFAAAALRGAQAASWKNRTDEAAQLAASALRTIHQLPERQAEFARGLAHYLNGRADSAVAWFTRALTRTPDWTEAHMALGEVYHHLLPATAAPLDSLAKAEFVAATADTGFAPPYFHLTEIAIREGDLDAAERLRRRFDRPGTGEEERTELDLMFACARRKPQPGDWQAAVSESPWAVLTAAKMLAVAGAYPDCAESALRALTTGTADETVRYSATSLYLNLLAARGKRAALAALTDSSPAVQWHSTKLSHLVNALAEVPGYDDGGRRTIRALRATYGPGYEDSLSGGDMLLLGAWYARSGDTINRDRLLRRLNRQVVATDDVEARLRVQVLRAHVLLAEADTAATLRALGGLTPVALRDDLIWGSTQSLPVERLMWARLLLSRHRYRDVIHVAAAFDHPSPVVFLPFLPASLHLRYRAAVALGKRGEAARYRARLQALGRTDLLGVLD